MWLYVSQCDFYIMATAAHGTVAVIAATSEQIWILSTADTYTDTLPWAWSHVIVTQIAYIKWPIVDLDRWRWRVS